MAVCRLVVPWPSSELITSRTHISTTIPASSRIPSIWVLALRRAGTFAGAGPFFSHDAETIAGFFGVAGLWVLHGRPMNVQCWPACPVEASLAEVQVIGGIGIRE